MNFWLHLWLYVLRREDKLALTVVRAATFWGCPSRSGDWYFLTTLKKFLQIWHKSSNSSSVTVTTFWPLSCECDISGTPKRNVFFNLIYIWPKPSLWLKLIKICRCLKLRVTQHQVLAVFFISHLNIIPYIVIKLLLFSTCRTALGCTAETLTLVDY